jgi:hypothetical protein
MSLPIFFELERIVGREIMRRLCQQYLYECADGSGNRFWSDCSGEVAGSNLSTIFPESSFTTPPKNGGTPNLSIKAPRARPEDILSILLEPPSPPSEKN